MITLDDHAVLQYNQTTIYTQELEALLPQIYHATQFQWKSGQLVYISICLQ